MQKIKQFIESEKGRNVLIVVIVILVGFVAFELGRLSKQNGSDGVKIEYPTGNLTQDIGVVNAPQTANVLSAVKSTKVKTSSVAQKNTTLPAPAVSEKNFFASTKGHKYYPVGCSAGKSLKMENRIYFASREAAEAAGYTLSSSCR